MTALARFQAAIICQAAESDRVAPMLSKRAREFVAGGVLLACATIAANPAQAQNPVLTPSNCAMAGQRVGNVIGEASPSSSAGKAIGGVLGALAGAALGQAACAPQRDSSYGGDIRGQQVSYGVGPQESKSPLTPYEREQLDALATAAIDAKYAWKRALWDIDQAYGNGGRALMAEGLKERESEARAAFDLARREFTNTVVRMNNGAGNTEPRAVGRYLEIAGGLMELNTRTVVSYQSLNARDAQLMASSQAYAAATNAATASRPGRMR